MQIKHIMNIKSGQDGAIFKDFIFRFEADGKGFVYSIKGFFEQVGEPVMLEPIAEIELDKRDLIIPHSNSVVFGNEYYEEGDEFPLL